MFVISPDFIKKLYKINHVKKIVINFTKNFLQIKKTCKMKNLLYFVVLAMIVFSCSTDNNQKKTENNNPSETQEEQSTLTIQERINQYATIQLNPDTTSLTDNQKHLLKLLIEAADMVNDIFWQQNFGNKQELTSKISDKDTLLFANINYGPWDILQSNEPFVPGYGKKPAGANFYPSDIKYLPFVQMPFSDKLSMYTIIRRNPEDNTLYTIPYHEAYKAQIEKIAEKLREAEKYCDNESFKNYLEAKIKTLETDDYYPSDALWMDMKDRKIDLIMGAYDTELDKFLNLKAAFEAFVMVRNDEWTGKLANYIQLLPTLQKDLPVSDKYKNQKLALGTDMVVCDLVYVAGYTNFGPKQLAITRPIEGKVTMEKGTRKIQFMNVTEAKFNKILYPIAQLLIDSSQSQKVTSQAFFEINFFFEISEGLILKKTVDNKGSVKDALKDFYNIARNIHDDVMRLFLLSKLSENKELNVQLESNFVTYLADMFRSIRFGTAHSQAKAAIINLNFFLEKGAITRNPETGKYKINFDKMRKAVEEQTKNILIIEGNGDYEALKKMYSKYSTISEELKKDIARVNNSNIPVDIRFDF